MEGKWVIFERRKSSGGRVRDCKKQHYGRKSENYKKRMLVQRMMVGNQGQNKKWTIEELEQLNCPDTHRELAVRMGRSLCSVGDMCRRVKYAIRERVLPSMRKHTTGPDKGIWNRRKRDTKNSEIIQRYVRTRLRGKAFRPFDDINKMGEARYFKERR